MTRIAHLVVSAVIGGGCVTSLLLFHRLTVYPLAVATLLPIMAAVIYTVMRAVGWLLALSSYVAWSGRHQIAGAMPFKLTRRRLFGSAAGMFALYMDWGALPGREFDVTGRSGGPYVPCLRRSFTELTRATCSL